MPTVAAKAELGSGLGAGADLAFYGFYGLACFSGSGMDFGLAGWIWLGLGWLSAWLWLDLVGLGWIWLWFGLDLDGFGLI